MRAESRVFLDLQGAYWSQYKTCNESSLGTVDGVPEIWDGLGLADPALGTIGRICLFFGSYGSRHCFGVFWILWISDFTIWPKRIGLGCHSSHGFFGSCESCESCESCGSDGSCGSIVVGLVSIGALDLRVLGKAWPTGQREGCSEIDTCVLSSGLLQWLGVPDLPWLSCCRLSIFGSQCAPEPFAHRSPGRRGGLFRRIGNPGGKARVEGRGLTPGDTLVPMADRLADGLC
jgi:hypothetical protein